MTKDKEDLNKFHRFISIINNNTFHKTSIGLLWVSNLKEHIIYTMCLSIPNIRTAFLKIERHLKFQSNSRSNNRINIHPRKVFSENLTNDISSNFQIHNLLNKIYIYYLFQCEKIQIMTRLCKEPTASNNWTYWNLTNISEAGGFLQFSI